MKPRLLASALFAGALTTLTFGANTAMAEEPRVTVDLGSGVSMELVLVRAGKLIQGSFNVEKDRSPDETFHEVTLSRAFYMGKTEVTVGQYRRFVADSGYRTEAERGTSGGYGWDGKALVQKKEFNWQNPGFPQTDDSPVVLVTFDDAVAFNDWLSKKSGRRVELPTESQFEYALRAGTRTRYYAGDAESVADKIGWHSGNSGNTTHPVAQKQPNEFGLYDMAGNAWEWCRDYYGAYPEGQATDPLILTSPTTEDKPRRVLRGGSWLKDPKNLRSAARYRNAPGSRNADNGFRVVASVEMGVPAPASSPAKTTPTAPISPQKPPTTPEEDAKNRELGTCVCIGFPVFGGGLILLLWGLRKNKPRSSGGRFGVTWSGAADGFSVLAPAHLRGKRLHYRVRSQNGWIPGAIVLEGSHAGQFVYTGSAPMAVDLQRIEDFHGGPPGSSAHSYGSQDDQYSGSRIPLGSSTYEPSRNDEPFRGYPSAY